MNCRQGDIARIVSSVHPENIDRFVFVKGPLRGDSWFVGSAGSPLSAHNWLGVTASMREGWIADASLRPLRDGPAPDETLAWCPREVCA